MATGSRTSVCPRSHKILGGLAMIPSVLKTRQRDLQNAPLPTRCLVFLVSFVTCNIAVLQ